MYKPSVFLSDFVFLRKLWKAFFQSVMSLKFWLFYLFFREDVKPIRARFGLGAKSQASFWSARFSLSPLGLRRCWWRHAGSGHVCLVSEAEDYARVVLWSIFPSIFFYLPPICWQDVEVCFIAAGGWESIIQGTANCHAAAIDDMGIDHGRFDVFVSE